MNIYDDTPYGEYRKMKADYYDSILAAQLQAKIEDKQQRRFNDAMDKALGVGAAVGIGGIFLVLFIFYILPDLPFWFLPMILTGVGAGFVTFQHTYNEKDESPDD